MAVQFETDEREAAFELRESMNELVRVRQTASSVPDDNVFVSTELSFKFLQRTGLSSSLS